MPAIEVEQLPGLAFAGVVLFLAYFVRGIAGFGSGLISVPLLALFYPIQIVVPLVVFLDYVGSASQGLRNRQLIAWREQWPLIPFMVIGVGCGLTLLSLAESSILAQALGGFVIVYAIYQLLPLPQLRGSKLFVLPFGFLGGFVGTLQASPDEWLATFADPMRAQAAIDRFTSNAYDLVIEGESYRSRLKPSFTRSDTSCSLHA